MRGTQTAIKVDRGGETVQSSVTFVLGRTGQIVVGGVSQDPLEGVSDAGHRRFIRPVLGGTGAYLGARGQLVTVRRADGRYDQRFELLR